MSAQTTRFPHFHEVSSYDPFGLATILRTPSKTWLQKKKARSKLKLAYLWNGGRSETHCADHRFDEVDINFPPGCRSFGKTTLAPAQCLIAFHCYSLQCWVYFM